MSDNKPSLLHRFYTQKSRLFLLPLAGIDKHKYFKSRQTYVSSSDLRSEFYSNGISPKDRILIVVYGTNYRDKDEVLYSSINNKIMRLTGEKNIPTSWEKFETEYLLGNKDFLCFHQSEDELVYTFSLSEWYDDWGVFLKGRYSLFSDAAKDKIMKFRDDVLRDEDKKKLYCYLFPDEGTCMKDFAEEVGEDLKVIKQVGELCSKPDFEKETFTCCLKHETHEAES